MSDGQRLIFCGREIEIPTAGDYITSQVGDTPVIALRRKNGSISAMVNRCAHRFDNLLAVRSTCVGADLSYHNWVCVSQAHCGPRFLAHRHPGSESRCKHSPMIEFLMIPGAPQPVAPYTHATAADGWLFVTGQVPTSLDDDTAPLRRASLHQPNGCRARCIGGDRSVGTHEATDERRWRRPMI